MASAGPHEVRSARPRLPRASHQKMENTHYKREGKRLPWRNRQRWQVLDSGGETSASLPPAQGRLSGPRRCRLVPRGQGRVLTARALQQRPLCPAGWPRVGAFLGSWRSSAARGRRRSGGEKRLSARDPGGAPRPALQRLLSSAPDLEGGEPRACWAHGPRSAACP